jgi:predicted HicB family RNase H-like nuclease
MISINEDYQMETKKYVFRTNNEKFEIIKKMASENMKSINNYLNNLIDEHIENQENMISQRKKTKKQTINQITK